MDSINLGTVQVFFKEDNLATKPQPAPMGAKHTSARKVTLKEAEEVSGWKLWKPSYLPFEDMKLDTVYILGDEENTSSVALKYKNNSQWMVIKQQSIHSSKVPITFPLRSNSINDKPAAVFNHSVIATSQPSGKLDILNCLWEQDGFLMELEVPFVSEQDIKQIAESLQ